MTFSNLLFFSTIAFCSIPRLESGGFKLVVYLCVLYKSPVINVTLPKICYLRRGILQKAMVEKNNKLLNVIQ
jgi:hypothetical protein